MSDAASEHSKGSFTADFTPGALPWLSILVPAFNSQNYIPECLDSLLAQDARGVEIVVINDGSRDATGSIVEEYQDRYPALIRGFGRETSHGVAMTRNQLLEAARGRYLWFVDSDDIMAGGAVESLRQTVQRHQPDIVICDYTRGRHPPGRRGTAFRGPSRTVLRDPRGVLAGMFESGQLHPWSKITERRLWSNGLRFPAGRVFEDVAVMPRLAMRAATAVHIPEAWIFYRQRPGSILAEMTPEKCRDLCRSLVDFSRDVKDLATPLSPRALFAFRHYAARHFVGAMRHLRAWPDCSVRLPMQRECLEFLLQTIEGRLDWLLREYLRRGWVWRRLRLAHWVRVARNADSGRRGAVPLACA